MKDLNREIPEDTDENLNDVIAELTDRDEMSCTANCDCGVKNCLIM